MNERIRELAREAVTRFDRDMDGSMEPEELGQWVRADALDKFAELIVRECANMAESFHHHQYDFTGNLELHEFIKTHFGVEE